MSQTKVVEKIKTHVLCSITFYKKKGYNLLDYVEKYCRAGQATDDNTVHTQCKLDTQGYTHTHPQYVILITFTATMVARACLSVTLYVNCLSCCDVCEHCYKCTFQKLARSSSSS